jgi:hypothetical protein
MAKVGDPTTPDPGSDPAPGAQPPDATAQAQPVPPPVETVPTPDPKGPIPFDRHEVILRNARTKTEQEVTQRFQEQYAPHVEFGNKFRADPVGTLAQSVAELSEHPEYGPQIISALARTLGSRRGLRQAAPAETDEPQADLQTPDGLRVFSADQQGKREAWLKQQWLQEVDQRLTPFQQREEAARATEQREAATKDAHTRMSKVIEPYKALPEFAEHREAIAAKTQALLSEGHDASTALGLAVATVLREVVMPSRAAQSRNDLVAQAVAKSTGSTTVPGTAPAAPAKRPTSMAEGFSAIRF